TAREVWYLPAVPTELAPVLAALPLQLFAYHMAKARGLAVDKPRNLAKRVTVEYAREGAAPGGAARQALSTSPGSRERARVQRTARVDTSANEMRHHMQ